MADFISHCVPPLNLLRIITWSLHHSSILLVSSSTSPNLLFTLQILSIEGILSSWKVTWQKNPYPQSLKFPGGGVILKQIVLKFPLDFRGEKNQMLETRFWIREPLYQILSIWAKKCETLRDCTDNSDKHFLLLPPPTQAVENRI